MKQFHVLDEFLDHAWMLLMRGVADPKSVAKNPTFSTVSEEGFPTMRTVVLRRADRIANCLEIHTDIQTNKVSSLKKNNFAGLHFWIPRSRVNPRTKRIFRADFRLQFDAASQSAFSPSRFGTV